MAKTKVESLEVEHSFNPYTTIDFADVQKRANAFADCIESRKKSLIDILLTYESFEVAEDEIERTLDHLRSLSENEAYFKLRVGSITTFLPRNQPLYALTCFVAIPSLMASEVHFRVPHGMRTFLPVVMGHLEFFKYFPNAHVSEKTRLEFLKQRSAVIFNAATKKSIPVTDAVIFTGTPVHADQLRLVFDKRTLFITNGSGHNPIVISQDADLPKAVEAVLALCLYNQGQDCAAPNSILVHSKVYNDLLKRLRKELAAVKIGPYTDRSCRVGPISDPDDLARIAAVILENRQWMDESSTGNINISTAIVTPVVITKPLSEGGNYEEFFAPILMIQRYEKDFELASYFENVKYALNAMYVTLYGTSKYITDFIDKEVHGKVLLKKEVFLHNKHLHAHGVERGTQPYGGYGIGASSLGIDGRVIAKPTLPQRDIFEWVAKPIMEGDHANPIHIFDGDTYTKQRDVEKLLKHQRANSSDSESKKHEGHVYLDTFSIKDEQKRYVKIEESSVHPILPKPHIEHIAKLDIEDIKYLRALKHLIEKKPKTSFNDFNFAIFKITKDSKLSEEQNKVLYQKFFRNVYMLLLGTEQGPRLGQFLWDLPEDTVNKLLDV